jgi:hypothetical protein
MRTNVPLFTTEAEARSWHLPLPADHVVLAGEDGYWEAAAEVEVSVLNSLGSDTESMGDDAFEQFQKTVGDAVNNSWAEGLTMDEWASASLRLLRGGA